jgi:hypothetical protein
MVSELVEILFHEVQLVTLFLGLCSIDSCIFAACLVSALTPIFGVVFIASFLLLY